VTQFACQPKKGPTDVGPFHDMEANSSAQGVTYGWQPPRATGRPRSSELGLSGASPFDVLALGSGARPSPGRSWAFAAAVPCDASRRNGEYRGSRIGPRPPLELCAARSARRYPSSPYLDPASVFAARGEFWQKSCGCRCRYSWCSGRKDREQISRESPLSRCALRRFRPYSMQESFPLRRCHDSSWT